MAEAIVIGGANGVGKSTFARYVLPVEMPFLNADEIAKSLPDDFPGNREIESGRQLFRRMDSLAGGGSSFAVETTLASRSLRPRLRELQSADCHVVLFYIWVPDPTLSVERVAARVRSGGHAIPVDTIHQRYWAGLRNLFRTYLPLADVWHVYENRESPRMIASQHRDQEVRIEDVVIWNEISAQGEQHERR
jgi:predicted ABC-type ATPase